MYILTAFLRDTNFIKLNRHFMSTYFHLDPFEFPYYSNGSRRKYVDIKCLLCLMKYIYIYIYIYIYVADKGEND